LLLLIRPRIISLAPRLFVAVSRKKGESVPGTMASVQERNPDATVYVGELDQRVTEPLLWELFLQVGPVGEFELRYYLFFRGRISYRRW
jgi:hypothetical protein